MSDPLDAATRDQLDMDRAEAAYEQQCWREDRNELHGLRRKAKRYITREAELEAFIRDEGRRRAASMQFDAPDKSGPVVPQRRDVA